jgi:hypothetical protein
MVRGEKPLSPRLDGGLRSSHKSEISPGASTSGRSSKIPSGHGDKPSTLDGLRSSRKSKYSPGASTSSQPSKRPTGCGYRQKTMGRGEITPSDGLRSSRKSEYAPGARVQRRDSESTSASSASSSKVDAFSLCLKTKTTNHHRVAIDLKKVIVEVPSKSEYTCPNIY